MAKELNLHEINQIKKGARFADLLPSQEVYSDEDDDEDDNEETDDDYSPDIFGDLEMKDLDEEGLAVMNSILYNQESGTSRTRMFNNDHHIAEQTKNALVFAGNEDDNDDDIDSEEERDIMKEIREEIEIKVRDEMKDELAGFQSRLKAIESGHTPGEQDEKKDVDDSLRMDENMDPRLKEAIIKMNKLDKILKKKLKIEREVKKERLLLERRMRKEIAEMDQGTPFYREIKFNTEKFLSLELPSTHNEGIILDNEDNIPPVFQTQIDEAEIKTNINSKNKAGGDHTQENQKSRSELNTPNKGETRNTASSMSRPPGKGNTSKNFIKRNKKLAAHGNDPIAMTDDEKKRLEELLEGVDDLPDIENPAEPVTVGPYQLAVHPGEGFCPDTTERMSLTNINEQLKQIMPEEEFNAMIVNTMKSNAVSHQLFTRVGIKTPAVEEPGERTLFETKEERELSVRLQTIEKELEKFKIPQEMEDEEEKHLTDEQLEKLLDECVRNLSRTSYLETPDSTPRSQLSSRQYLMENPPLLSEEQLQKLLSEAHFPLSSKLLALREDDDKILEEEGDAETIRAETWKAIKDTKPGGEIDSDSDEEDTIIASKHVKATDKSVYNLEKDKSSNNAADFSPCSSSETYLFDSVHDSSDSSPSSFGSFHVDRRDHISSVKKSVSEITYSNKPGDHFKSLPKISLSIGELSRVSSLSSSGELSRAGSLSSISQESFENEILRLPHLSPNHCLIQAQQGLSDQEVKFKASMTTSKQVFQMMEDDLSELKDYYENEIISTRGHTPKTRTVNNITPKHDMVLSSYSEKDIDISTSPTLQKSSPVILNQNPKSTT
ncbi:unnamed protein product [Lymnaea stagnalis]|uniref:Fibrous sheath-interacting protein 1 n=1 Tax=Lymnaea stagnalis TaxID=6523 RepID=A0AAV2HGW2_LYMST